MASFDPFNLAGGGSVGGLSYDAPLFDLGGRNAQPFGPSGGGAGGVGSPSSLGLAQVGGMGAGYGVGKGLTYATGQQPFSLDAASWFKGPDTAALNGIERAPASFDWANAAGGLVDMAANAGAGWAGSKLATWDNSPGEAIGGGIGGAAGGFFFGPPGAFLGSALGTIAGSWFGPEPTVGPNFNVNYALDEFGRLVPVSAGADNGMDRNAVLAMAQGPAAQFQGMLDAYGGRVRPGFYGNVRGGTDGMQPTLEFGRPEDPSLMAPALNENSFFKALLQNGWIEGLTPEQSQQLLAALGGADPTRIFTGTNWVEPESIHPIWQGGVYDTGRGYQALDTGRIGNVMLEPQYAPGSTFGWTDSGYQAMYAPPEASFDPYGHYA